MTRLKTYELTYHMDDLVLDIMFGTLNHLRTQKQK